MNWRARIPAGMKLFARGEAIAREGFLSNVVPVKSTASDGRSGIEAAEKQDFSVAIVDLCMPNLNGIDTIREFRAMAPHMKLIAMSGLMSSSGGNTAPDFLGMAINLAGIPKLSKPFRRLELLDVVEQVTHKKTSDAA